LKAAQLELASLSTGQFKVGRFISYLNGRGWDRGEKSEQPEENIDPAAGLVLHGTVLSFRKKLISMRGSLQRFHYKTCKTGWNKEERAQPVARAQGEK
jgi:hypothetical protein